MTPKIEISYFLPRTGVRIFSSTVNTPEEAHAIIANLPEKLKKIHPSFIAEENRLEQIQQRGARRGVGYNTSEEGLSGFGTLQYRSPREVAWEQAPGMVSVSDGNITENRT